MNLKTTRTWAVILTVLLALSLLLTACGTSGTTPTGDNSTPGITETPGATEPTPDDTTEPSNTPSEPDPTPGKTYDEPVVFLPDPEDISEEYLAKINSSFTMGASSGAEVVAVVDNMLEEIYEKYGKYLNENISKLCVKIGLFSSEAPITPEALTKVNDLLEANGEEPLEQQDYKDKIAAIWLAASLFYDPDYTDESYQIFLEEYPGHRFDIGHAFALTKYSNPEDVKSCEQMFASDYANLFNIP